MSGLELVLLLLAASTALRIFAQRWRVPFATLLVVGGSILALIPNLPRVTVAPDTLFLIFVPPLLYWGAISFPLRDLRRESGSILRLSVPMVLVSAAAVAIVIHAIDPAFTWAAAFALGAIVSPPDPVAVLSILRWVHIPRDVERILEGEGLLNDATALVLYRFAVAAAITGIFTPWRAFIQFLVVAGGGVAIGLAVAAIVLRLRRLARDIDVADSTISLLTPFAAYLAADMVGTSGVIGVVAAAMYVGRNLKDIPSPASRVLGGGMWTVVTFLLESLVFILVGIELPYIVRDLHGVSVLALLWQGIAVFLCLVLARLLWVFPSAYIGRSIDRWLRQSHEPLPSWRTILFIGWAGVRGGDSLVIALALPAATSGGVPFPARGQIIFITFCVIFASLVVQAPTLRSTARALRLPSDNRAENEEAHARLTSVEAGLLALEAEARDGLSHPEVARYLQQRHRQSARRWAANEARLLQFSRGKGDHQHPGLLRSSGEAAELDERRVVEYRRIRSVMISAERRSVRALRDRGEIGDEIMWRIQRELDLEQMLLDGPSPVIESPGGLTTGDFVTS